MAFQVTHKPQSFPSLTLEKQGTLLSALRSVATLDLRSLALMRIGIAVVLIIDLFVRATDLRAHYTDQGILPLEALFRMAWNPYYFSIFTMSSSVPIQAMLFLVNLCCVLCLLVGYRTRLFTAICWFFLLSLHNRNPLITQAGDDLLRMILFWGFFLPWGYRYSADAVRKGYPLPDSNAYVSFAGFAYILQVFYVYFFSAILKSSGEWTSEFTALYYALSFEHIVTPFGQWLHQFEGFLRTITMMTFYIELVLPFLLLMPIFNRYFRTIFVVMIFCFQMGINLCLYVGLFPWISTVAMLGLLVPLTNPEWQPVKRWVSFITPLRERVQTYVTRYVALPPDTKLIYIPKEGLLTAVVILLFSLYTFTWNLQTIGRAPALFTPFTWIGHLLRVDQHWGMFAPSVFKDDGWFILEGITVNGKEIDIARNGEAVTYEKPTVVAEFFKNDRWRKYHENILFVQFSQYRPYYCDYQLNHWNEAQSPANKINQLRVIYMKQPNLPNYQEPEPTKEILYDCKLNNPLPPTIK
jgi:hypothetical protein